MDKETLLQRTEAFVQSQFGEDSSGHDWWHIHRVRNMALHIARIEGADLFLVELSALLHDIDDWKLNHMETGRAMNWLRSCAADSQLIDRVIEIINGVSFKGAGVTTATTDPECRVLQDADRLDAIGAIGIARTFAYGGSRGRLIFNPEIQPELHEDFGHYRKSTGPTINHFYEKLLLLKDRMQTPAGKIIAAQRHEFMVAFLNQFYAEWNMQNL